MTVDRLGQGLLGDKRWVASGRERAYPLTGPWGGGGLGEDKRTGCG